VKTEAERQLADLREELRKRGLEVETAVCEGYAATVIVEEAATRAVDLIVIGTHGLSGLKHMLLGSIAERVVQKAPCPVLTVKTPRAE
jgi:nucleotide-binding universal stress UspA family protein